MTEIFKRCNDNIYTNEAPMNVHKQRFSATCDRCTAEFSTSRDVLASANMPRSSGGDFDCYYIIKRDCYAHACIYCEYPIEFMKNGDTQNRVSIDQTFKGMFKNAAATK